MAIPWVPGILDGIECSAMIRAVLGNEIDIHTGGMDHPGPPQQRNRSVGSSEWPTTRTLLAPRGVHQYQ